MKKTGKRILAVLLAGVLALSAGFVAASANEGGETLGKVTVHLKRFIYSEKNPDELVPFEMDWGPGLFAQPATAETYNPKLMVTASAVMHQAYYQQVGDEGKTLKWYYMDENHPGDDLPATLIKMGFDPDSIVCIRAEGEKKGGLEHSNYVTFATQTMGGFQLVAVLLRGTIDTSEWVSDFYLPGEDYVAGFQAPEQVILAELKKYLEDNDPGLARKILITGHSRGAAIANLLGHDLNQPANNWTRAAKEDIYCYTYAASNVARTSVINSAPKDTNIWNFINRLDMVPHIPPSKGEWKYGKFGQNVILPADNQVGPIFNRLSGLDADKANDGWNAKVLGDLLGVITVGKWNGSIFPDFIRPLINQVFDFDEKTVMTLEELDEQASSVIKFILGLPVQFLPFYVALKANGLSPVVYQHTSETYIARSMILAGYPGYDHPMYIERAGGIEQQDEPIILGYRTQAKFQFSGAQGEVKWDVKEGKDKVKLTNNSDGTITVLAKYRPWKFNLVLSFIPFIKGDSFTLTAKDAAGKTSEMTIPIEMPLWVQIVCVTFLGWVIGWFI